MLYYLDSNIVIYAVGGQPPLQQRSRNHKVQHHVGTLAASGAVS
jgi:hypothetical protein